MGLLAVVLILIVWAVLAIKEALTPEVPPIDDIIEHANIILSLPDEKARRKYTRSLAKAKQDRTKIDDENKNDKGEFIDSDFTRLTPAERERLEQAEAETEVVNFDDIDWK